MDFVNKQFVAPMLFRHFPHCQAEGSLFVAAHGSVVFVVSEALCLLICTVHGIACYIIYISSMWVYVPIRVKTVIYICMYVVCL